VGYRLILLLFAWLPASVSQAITRRVANMAFELGGERVEFMLVNLKIAYPERTESERRAIARKSYESLACNIVDVARSTRWQEREFREHVALEGFEHLKSAFDEGKGVLVLTLHMGNFELAIRRLPFEGIPVSAVGRPSRNVLVREHLRRQRERTGAVMMAHRKVLPQMLSQLRKGCVVPILNDQYVRPKMGIFVPLFGKRCSTSYGIAMLALRTGAPIIPSYIVRDGLDHHRIVILPRLDIERRGERQRDMERTMVRCNEVLEEMIRKYPEQWMWSHRRFRHSPDFERNPYKP